LRTGEPHAPRSFNGADWAAIAPVIDELTSRPIGSADALERWLVDRSDLEAACSEARAVLFINMTCRTDDEGAQRAYARYLDEVVPRLRPALFELDRRLLEAARLGAPGHEVLLRDTRADVDVYRPENVPIEVDLDKLSQRYDQIVGSMTVEFDGQTRTLPQMARYQESTDRGERERAWDAVAERRARERGAVDDIYDEMVRLRDRAGRNAGFKDYVGYAFRSMHRFDYGPAECEAFHDAVERCVVPALRRLDESRRRALGLERLRPWDLGVDPLGRPPLRPFDGGRDLVARSRRAFDAMDPSLAAMFARLGDGSSACGADGGASLDLDSRPGKAGGGYQYMLDRSRRSFIFMNAAGLHRDVETMVHEAGHAFHSMLCAHWPLLHDRHPPTEFAEVASMGMELLSMPAWDAPGAFYGTKEEADRARRQHLEGVLVTLPWVATIDAFQHWVYTHPRHSRDERTQAWLALDDRFGRSVDWGGHEEARGSAWQRQGHLFGAPFYYIEYGIALLGALQLWSMAIEQGSAAALAAYTRGLALGATQPLPGLFAATGLRFDFGETTIRALVDTVECSLGALSF
jgi:oligoendopeptidase F